MTAQQHIRVTICGDWHPHARVVVCLDRARLAVYDSWSQAATDLEVAHEPHVVVLGYVAPDTSPVALAAYLRLPTVQRALVALCETGAATPALSDAEWCEMRAEWDERLASLPTARTAEDHFGDAGHVERDLVRAGSVSAWVADAVADAKANGVELRAADVRAWAIATLSRLARDERWRAEHRARAAALLAEIT